MKQTPCDPAAASPELLATVRPGNGLSPASGFHRQHASSLWQIDFFSQKVLTLRGIRQAFVIAYLHVKTRRIILSPATLHPDEKWVVAQADGEIVCRQRLGGLLKYYHRRAA